MYVIMTSFYLCYYDVIFLCYYDVILFIIWRHFCIFWRHFSMFWRLIHNIMTSFYPYDVILFMLWRHFIYVIMTSFYHIMTSFYRLCWRHVGVTFQSWFQVPWPYTWRQPIVRGTKETIEARGQRQFWGRKRGVYRRSFLCLSPSDRSHIHVFSSL